MDAVPKRPRKRKTAKKLVKPGKEAPKVPEKPNQETRKVPEIPEGNPAESCVQNVSEKPSRDSGISEDLQPIQPPPPPKVFD